MALSANTERTFKAETYENTLPVAASTTIYKGSAVGSSSGYAAPLSGADTFQGFALAKADNGSGSAGDINVTVRKTGTIRAAIGSLAITNVGDAVYMSDDDTFTLSSTSNTYIGRVIRFIESGVGEIAFDVKVTA